MSTKEIMTNINNFVEKAFYQAFYERVDNKEDPRDTFLNFWRGVRNQKALRKLVRKCKGGETEAKWRISHGDKLVTLDDLSAVLDNLHMSRREEKKSKSKSGKRKKKRFIESSDDDSDNSDNSDDPYWPGVGRFSDVYRKLTKSAIN